MLQDTGQWLEMPDVSSFEALHVTICVVACFSITCIPSERKIVKDKIKKWLNRGERSGTEHRKT